MHVVLPLSSWYMPAAHSVHVDWPVAAVYVPGAHGTGAVEPVEHAEPAVHGVHAPALPRPDALEKYPAGHGSAAADPRGQ